MEKQDLTKRAIDSTLGNKLAIWNNHPSRSQKEVINLLVEAAPFLDQIEEHHD